MLFDLDHGGQRRAVVGQAGKTGWFYVNDRDSGALLFKSEAFVPQDNMFARPTADGVVVAPGAAGGASWSPASFDPVRKLAYVAAVHMPMRYSVRERPKTAEQLARRYSVTEPVEDLPQYGLLSAIDLAQGGKIKWQAKVDQPLIGGVVATAGGLVFMGEGNGWFNAFDSDTGARLWRFYCGAGVNAPPITYQAGGRQYVAVAAGGSKLFGYAEGDAVIAFALPE
jgi:glucose dehydrogenase